ncbi:cytochrome P450 [Chytriomyces sp. MP71]|nr:cytochrome P450 [Chytriomyces sp. MP71]
MTLSLSTTATTAAALLACTIALHAVETRNGNNGFETAWIWWPLVGHAPLLRNLSLYWTRITANGRRSAANVNVLGAGLALASATAVKWALVSARASLAPSWPKRWQALMGQNALSVVADPRRHRTLRALMAQGVGSEALARCLPQMRSNVRALLHQLVDQSRASKTSARIHETAKGFTFNAILLFVYGSREKDVDVMRRHLPQFETWTFGLVDTFIPVWMNGPHCWALKAKERVAHDVRAIIASRRASVAHPTTSTDTSNQPIVLPATDALQRLLAATNAQGDHLTEAELLDNLWLLVFAGTDTTAAALASAVHCFARALRPDERAALEAEVMHGWAADGSLTCAELAGLPVLDAFVREVLRLHPPVANVDRIVGVNGGVEFLDERWLNEGQVVKVAVGALGYDPGVFEDPSVFRLGRFLGEARKFEGACAYAPFSAGARQCLGMQLAKLEIKVFMFEMIQSFTLTADAKPSVQGWLPIEFMDPYVTLEPRVEN